MSESYVPALLAELHACQSRGLTARVVAIKAELARFGVAVDDAPEIETASVEAPETAAVRRGRPRKGV